MDEAVRGVIRQMNFAIDMKGRKFQIRADMVFTTERFVLIIVDEKYTELGIPGGAIPALIVQSINLINKKKDKKIDVQMIDDCINNNTAYECKLKDIDECTLQLRKLSTEEKFVNVWMLSLDKNTVYRISGVFTIHGERVHTTIAFETGDPLKDAKSIITEFISINPKILEGKINYDWHKAYGDYTKL